MNLRDTHEPFPLRTNRLVLRRFSESDLAAFCSYRNDPDVARYQSWESCSVGEASEFLQTQKALQWATPGEWFQIAITLKETGNLVGDCALQISSKDNRQATIGVTLAAVHQGHGFAHEALSSLLEYAFRSLELHRIVADTDPENKPAQILLERLGMRLEGHLKESLWFKGRWVDELIYAILRDEWLQRSQGESR